MGLREEIGKRRPFDSPEEEAFLNMQRTACLLGAEAGRLLKRYGLSEGTYNVLRILRGHHPAGIASQSIAPMMVTPVPDVTRLVDRLEENGLAERVRTEHDRRVVIVRIRRAGLELLAKLDRPLLELQQQQFKRLTKAELGTLSRLLVAARQRGE
jgi:DNA-binding MarR family transcriptional regulator